MPKNRYWSNTMVWILAAWVCTLPLIGLVVVPIWGAKVGVTLAVGLLIAMLLLCWGWCGWRVHRLWHQFMHKE